MKVWLIDIYTHELDATASHRTLAKGKTKEDALVAASAVYPNDKDLVVVGRSDGVAEERPEVQQLLVSSELLLRLW